MVQEVNKSFKTAKKPRGRPALTQAHKDKIIVTARLILSQYGLEALRARALAQAAGVSLGSLYKFYPDMQAIIGAVKLDVYRELTLHLRAAMDDMTRMRCLDRLMQLAWAYLDYVRAHDRLWTALLDSNRSEGGRSQAFINAEDHLFAVIEHELQALPKLSRKQAPVLARAMWASVHGIVAQTLPNSLHEDPVADTLAQIEMIIGSVVRDHS